MSATRNLPHLMLGTPLTACLKCMGQARGRSAIHESTCRYATKSWEPPLAFKIQLVLLWHGVDSVENQGLHGWRCKYPEFGDCHCFEDLMSEIDDVLPRPEVSVRARRT